MRLSPKQNEALEIVSAGKYLPTLTREADGWHARWRAIGIDNPWVDACVREANRSAFTADAEDHPHATLHDAFMAALTSITGLVRWNDAKCAAFSAVLEKWAEPIIETPLEFAFEPTESGAIISLPRPKTMIGLRTLGYACDVYARLREMTANVTGEVAGVPPRTPDIRLQLTLSQKDVEEFLRSGARALIAAGHHVEGLPKLAEISVGAELLAPETNDGKAKSEIKLVVHVAGEKATIEEIRFMLEQGGSIVFFHNRWIEVDRNILKQALRALERGAPKKPNLLAFAFGLERFGQLEINEFKLHGWVRGLVEQLRQSGKTIAPEIKPNELRRSGFVGELRDYQQRGASWLRFLTSHGFGALLADDMGLGKTVQTIAWLVADRKVNTPALIVTPLSLVSNWRHELKRFAPKLTEKEVEVVHYHRFIKDYGVYAMRRWSTLVIDEAQAIKNPKTHLANAVKSLSPKHRIALSGTPIENSVADLWAIEDFLNPGFLGDFKTFRERFVKPLSVNPNAAIGAKLRHAMEPFMLRRLKTEPGIAKELGEKREVREYCTLSPKQYAAYENALAAYRATSHTPGDVFALITELKLVCDGEGKLLRLIELLKEIFAAGESALVFTQYAKIGAWLKRELDCNFSIDTPFLHGGLSALQREKAINSFMSAKEPSAFILSLKAGGYGLNLTKATHVIHFDRWWNPAAENQATDRAHRIGQTRTVFSHCFITENTLEERIDDILRTKETLEGLLVPGEEFLKLVNLNRP